jgi:hypothetical protein
MIQFALLCADLQMDRPASPMLARPAAKDDAGWYSFKVTSPSDPTGAAEQMREIGREDAVAKWFHLRLSTRRNQRRSEP